MPSRAELGRLYQELLDRYGRTIADAFLVALNDLRTAAEIQRLTDAIRAGNLQDALDALHLDAAAYGPLQDAIAQAYAEGGQNAAQALPKRTPEGQALVIRFHARNPRAEAWLREQGADLVTHVIEDQREAVRQRLIAGMEKGENPRTTALDIVGRINRITGKREGGILGLTAQQETFARNAADELASGDPAALRKYLDRSRRDKRFDRSILKAIREESPVPPEIQSKAVARYKDRLLELRGTTLGRAEALAALQAAKLEAYTQAVEAGQLDGALIEREWDDVGDARTRHSHRLMNGQKRGLHEPFVSPSGARLMYPGDTSLGASASETIQCRCDVRYRVRFLAGIR